MQNKNILIGITGGIAAYKICELVRLFKKNGANIKVVVTPSALEFVTELTLDTLSQERVYTEQFNTTDKKPEHISLCDWADAFVIAPISANTIGKIANGICDNLLTSLACAYQGLNRPMFFAPAMNTGMWNNVAVQKNLDMLRQGGGLIIEPEDGFLACGTSGVGRMTEVQNIYKRVEDYFTQKQFLKGKKVVVTSGGTRENLDPVRYIGNYSSGKMGAALAQKASEAGAEVVLITSASMGQIPAKVVQVNSALEMFEAAKSAFESADIFIMAAAVADYRPETCADEKIKKENSDEIILKLVKNPDILSELCKVKRADQQVIGFCAESENLIENAKQKIVRKSCDYLVANDISRKDTGFSSDFNEVFVLDKKLNVTKIEKNTKDEIASKILELLYGKND